MEASKISGRVWENIVTTNQYFGFRFFAVNILLSQLKLRVKKNHDRENIRRCADELKNFFTKTSRLPMAGHDLMNIYLGGGKII